MSPAPPAAPPAPAIAPGTSTPAAPATSAPPPPATSPPPAAPPPSGDIARRLAETRRLALDRGRSDLVERLDRVRDAWERRTITVALVGEFKKGKSTMVNALLQSAVCPTDADVVTVVPTTVRHGETASAVAHLESGSPGRPVTAPVALDAIAEFVSEVGNPANARRLRSLEIALPHRLLASGLCLVDTPGVGGLDSAFGIVTLGVLDQVDGVLFVTDASAELNRPEVDFLRAALERCPRAACVVTKTDLHPHWREIVERDRAHLAAAGLELPVFGVSSFLRLRSARRPELLAESGYRDLIAFLARTVATGASAAAATAAAAELAFVGTQLAGEVAAEQAVLTEPSRAAEVVRQLSTVRDRTAGLTTPAASWQQVLTDGVQDLVANVQHDLQERLRGVLREAEALIDAADPKHSWDDIEEWLRRQAVTAAVANYDLLKEQATDLARYVAESFDLEAGPTVTVAGLAPPPGLASLALASVESLSAPAGRLASVLTATRTAVFVPMALFGIAGSLLGAVVMVPLSLALAGGIGSKLLRDERRRQLAQRRQQGRLAARRFVDEVGFIMGKETQDALRRTQRQLRDDFQARAAVLQRSAGQALGAVTGAGRLSEAERDRRRAALAAQQDVLEQVGGAAVGGRS
ncbi:dynamin family protein [Nakamurella deserti]|uniref:dynamin family protein n=1 Tax=Nakamurella deserti TaxID=2164074 RepID=UPI00197C2381|nr:dynamin family protein [Nakamurella deserti]